ncbi:MFS transporter, partial [Georgenia sp. 10Sc9-8]|nr:MFS transporter [Georgenia halotolerans]
HGLSTAWLLEGLAVWLIVIPIALLVFGRRPLHPGRQTTAGGAPAGHAPPAATGWSVRDALRTPMFWVIDAAVAASGMLTTGLNFHQIAALGEQGLTASQAALNFLPQAVTTMTVTIAIGALADKVAPKYGLVVAMLLLAGSLLTLSMVDSMWTALLYGGLLGAAGGSVRTVEAAAFTHYFGTANIGAIRGLATTISVASTAFGPLALSLGQDLTGSYGTTALGLLLIPLTVAVGAVLVRPPQRRGGPAAGTSADRLDHTPA